MTARPSLDARRGVELIALPALLLAAMLLPPLLLAGRLPGRVAIHFGLGGGADGTAPRGALVILALVWLGLWAASLVADRRDALAGRRLRFATPLLFLGGVLAVVNVLVVLANLDVATPAEARLSPLLVPVALAAMGIVAWVAARCERGRPGDGRAARGTAGRATVGLARGELGVWLGGVGRRLPVRVTVSGAGVDVRIGTFGLLRKRVPLERIARAEAIDVEPLQWGGWGYRWAGPGRTAIVLRRGPGLLLDLRDGGSFVVTVDRPEVAAGLVNDLVARATA